MFRRGMDSDRVPGAVEDRHHHDRSVRVFFEKHFIKGPTGEATKGSLFCGRRLAGRYYRQALRIAEREGSSAIEEVSEVIPSAARRAWARLITQMYEVDPLVCPRCAGPMRIIAFIEQPAVIEKILAHLGLWPAQAHSPPGQSRAA